MTWSIHGENFIVIRPALHNGSQTNEKNTPNIWLFWQRKIFCTQFGSFCTIQKRFDQNWIKNNIAVRVYFWALFANLDFLNFLLAPLYNALHCNEKWHGTTFAILAMFSSLSVNCTGKTLTCKAQKMPSSYFPDSSIICLYLKVSSQQSLMVYHCL